MKIALVAPGAYGIPGGVQHHIRDLSASLRKRGHQVSVIAAGSERPPDRETHYFGREFSVPFNGTTVEFCYAAGQARRELSDFLIRSDFDLIHFHTIWNPLMPLQILSMSRNLRAKRVATFHDTPNSTLTASLMGVASRFLSPYLHGLISVSEAQAGFLRFRSPVRVIPNGVFCETFSPKNNSPLRSCQDGKTNILFVGALVNRKRIFDLLEAYSRLKARHDLRLLVVGSGYLQGEVSKFVRARRLRDVELMGAVDEKTKCRAFASAQIFCSPASYGESFGIVLLEAMASGVPAVGAANPGYRTVLTGAGSELLYEPGDPVALEAKIESLLVDSEFRRRMSEWGISTAKHYDWDVVTTQILEVYEATGVQL